MARIPGTFVPLDVYYLRDPAIQRVGPEAELLYLRSLAHSKAVGSQGVVTAYDLAAISVGLKGVPTKVQALVRERLWEVVEDGWRIRSWLRWNRSTDEITEQKQAKRDGAIKTNHTRYHTDGRTDDSCPLCHPGNVHPLRGHA